MSIPRWSANTLYQPGAFVLPRSGQGVVSREPDNPSFEDGLTQWTVTYLHGSAGPGVVASTDQSFDGTMSAYWAGNAGSGVKSSVTAIIENAFLAPVVPGLKITVGGYLYRNTTPSASSACDGAFGIMWYDSSNNLLKTDQTVEPGGINIGSWEHRTGTFTAPALAAFAQFFVSLTGNTSGAKIYADNCTWDYVYQNGEPGLVFVAVQAAAGLSGSTEPVWPVVDGDTVVDNAVTWEAEVASRIIWTAEPILRSGDSEPAFSDVVGGVTADFSIAWIATDGRITDVNCPHSKIVAINSSKIFAGDDDIIAFSATNNPLDWSTQFDAGFLPFGLQTYGNEPVQAMGLYRSNLLAFNAIGYQMWQTDPDPSNMALLDASPVGCQYSKSGQPVNNDFVFLSSVGIRSIGIAGASTNLQTGSFGKQVDPLVQALVKLGFEPMALFFPGTGQYWLWFGNEAIVLTQNGGANQMSWSRYVFAKDIVNWTVLNGILYLRTVDDLVWQMDDETLVDDFQGSTTGQGFDGYMAWPYLDNGNIGLDKMMEGFDLVCTGSVNVSFGYDQNDQSLTTESFQIGGDTLPGVGMIPFPFTAPAFQMRLDFGSTQAWEWNAAVLYFFTENDT